MERSEEIRRVVERWTKTIGDGDADLVLGRLSEHPGTVIVGTDEDEWWIGPETRAIWGRQIEELGSSFQVAGDVIEAWEEGTVGWASVKETITVAGRSFASRATYVLHLERDEWKVVQVHWSLPSDNVEVFGRALTVTLEELEQTLEEGKDFDGGAIEGFARAGESDMIAIPDPSTFQLLPWRPRER